MSDNALARFFPGNDSAIEEYDDSAPQQFEGFMPEDRIMIPARISTKVLGQSYGGFGTLGKDEIATLPEKSRTRVKAEGKGHIFVGHKIKDTGEAVLWKFAELRMLPVVNLTSWYKQSKEEGGRSMLLGARTYWPIDPVTGQRDQDPSVRPACRSNDGYNPIAYYVGTEPTRKEMNAGFDPRYGQEVMFGYDLQGNELEPGEICIKCPLSQFVTSKDGKVLPPTCKESYNYIVWLPTQVDLDGNVMESRLAVISGNNTSIMQALKGRTPGQSFGHADSTKALVGIAKFKDVLKKSERAIPLAEFDNADLLSAVIAITETDSAAKKAQNKGVFKVAKGSIQSPEDMAELLDGLQAQGFSAAYAWIETETYMFAPKGMPHLVGGDAPVYPISMIVAENNSNPPQRIPYMNVSVKMGEYLHDPLTEDEFYEYMMAGQQAARYRKLWAEQIPANRDAVAEKQKLMREPNISVSDGPADDDMLAAGDYSSPTDD
jgi:hypothetical protein